MEKILSIMKRIPTVILFIFLTLVSASAKKQNEGKDVKYSLPQTVITLSIDCEEQDITAGPYGRYAKEMLGINTIEKDSTLFSIKRIELKTHCESDPSKIEQLHVNTAQAEKLFEL